MTTRTTSIYLNLLLERTGATTVLKVNRPDVLNALNRETLAEIEHAAQAFIDDPEQGALIVTGAGEKSFISGADINELAVLGPAAAQEISRFGQRVLDVLERSPKPVIAAVNGYALGAGAELAILCDIRIASEKARFGFPEVRVGSFETNGVTHILPRLVGLGKAKELMLTGDHIMAEEALLIGLVEKVVPHESLLDEARKIAQKIAANAPLSVSLVKTCLNKGAETTLETALVYETEAVLACAASEDMREGALSFLENRIPVFKGR